MNQQKSAVACLVVFALAMCASVKAADDIAVASPDGNVQFKLLLNESRLRFSVMLKDAMVVEPSPFVFTLDQTDIADGDEIGKPEHYTHNETFPCRLIHSTATDHCNGMTLLVHHTKSGTDYTLEVRAYDNGVAFRTIITGKENQQRVPDERTTFVLPDGSTVWHHNLVGHYEGDYKRTVVSEIAANEWCAPPMTYKLPGGAGYASITEADLKDYPGMALECDGKRGFAIGLGDREPISHPYQLRYSKEDIARVQTPAEIAGTITTPWRVILIAPDLNGLVNSDVVQGCCPPPDAKLFPEGANTDWCKSGRAVWRYLDGGENSINGIRQFSKLASQLGFEYQVVEGLWTHWSDDDLRSVVDESNKEGVKLIVWEHSKDLRDANVRHVFLNRLHDFGIAGAKIDFFDNEGIDTVGEYQALLREGAELHLLMDFHGANKPSGESRTWPNELSREAIHGMEASRLNDRAFHETTLPFTRFLAGHAEYTVVHFGPRRSDTSVAHQIASAAILSSELLTYALNPQKMLDSPAVEMFKTIPSTWDETIVLPPSEISEMAVYARRRGDTWFLACMNGPEAHSVDIPLSFLADGEYHTMLVRDGKDETPPATRPTGITAIVVEHPTTKRGDSIKLDFAPGGGFIARFSK